MRDFKNEAEVEAYFKETGHKVIIFEGSVFDVADYMSTHPGGPELIEDYLGKCIDEPFEENGHTKAARKIFQDLERIGDIVGGGENSSGTIQPKGLDGYQLESKLNFDYSKGMYKQLLEANLNWDDYIQFINEPKHLVNPIRDIVVFDNKFFEFFTMTPWYAIPLAWGPLIVYFYMQSTFSLLMNILIIGLGILGWTLGEYLLHRFIFHSEDYWLPNHPKVLAHHFLLHGIHHAFPMDRYRLVFPILPGYIVFTIFFIAPLLLVFPTGLAEPLISGFMIGYVLYDLIHYFLHHSSPKDGYWRSLKIYHM